MDKVLWLIGRHTKHLVIAGAICACLGAFIILIARQDDDKFRKFIKEGERIPGQVIGAGTIKPERQSKLPEKYFVSIRIHPDISDPRLSDAMLILNRLKVDKDVHEKFKSSSYGPINTTLLYLPDEQRVTLEAQVVAMEEKRNARQFLGILLIILGIGISGTAVICRKRENSTHTHDTVRHSPTSIDNPPWQL